MQINEYQHQTYVTLAPEGDLDANSSVHLEEKLRDLINRNQVNIHIDGSRIPYMSSAGMGVFVSHIDELSSKGGRFVLSNLADNVAYGFTLLGLNQLEDLILAKETEIGTYFD